MRTVRNLFLAILAVFSIACSSNDDELGNWRKVESFGGKPRSGAVSFKVGEVVYVGLGIDKDNYELSDFWSFTNKWDEVAAMPDSVARYGAVAFSDGRYGYVGLGYAKRRNSGAAIGERWFTDFWRFDPEGMTGDKKGSWSQIASFPGAVRRFGVGFFVDGKGYVGTGYGQGKEGVYKDYWEFDPNSNTNGLPGAWKSLGVYGEAREGATVFVVDKSAYICMGIEGSSYIKDFIKFTPGAAEGEKWMKLNALKDLDNQGFDNDYDRIPRAYAAAFVVGEGQETRAYVTTGMGSNGKYSWEYNPFNDRWDEVTEFSGSSRLQAVGFTFRGTGYVSLGGVSTAESTDKYRDTYLFQPGVDDDDQDDDIEN